MSSTLLHAIPTPLSSHTGSQSYACSIHSSSLYFMQSLCNPWAFVVRMFVCLCVCLSVCVLWNLTLCMCGLHSKDAGRVHRWQWRSTGHQCPLSQTLWNTNTSHVCRHDKTCLTCLHTHTRSPAHLHTQIHTTIFTKNCIKRHLSPALANCDGDYKSLTI